MKITNSTPHINTTTVKFNYSKGYFNYNRKKYPLKDYNKYLLDNYGSLCLKYVLRSLPVGNGMYKRTFAWDTIYFEARKKGILLDYLIQTQSPNYEREYKGSNETPFY